MATTPPATVAEFKDHFDRDFKYGTGLDTVRDKDISRAMTQALAVFNPCLWSSSEVKIPFMLASAHMLVVSVQAAGGLSAVNKNQGTENRGGGMIGSKSVGPVSVQYAGLEAWVQKFPSLADLLRTDYGAQYLLLLKPRLVGNILVVEGDREPGVGAPNIPFVGP